MNQVGVERDEMAPRMSEARTTFPNVIAITFVVFLGCEGNNEGDPSRVGTVLDAGVVDAAQSTEIRHGIRQSKSQLVLTVSMRPYSTKQWLRWD